MSSPSISPGRLTRVQEKAELSELNDRLSVYINYVRDLKESNAQLTQELTVLRTSQAIESGNLRALWDEELVLLRNQLDKVTTEKATALVQAEEANSRAADAESNNDKLRKRVKQLERELEDSRHANVGLESQVKGLQAELKALRAQIASIEEDRDSYKNSAEANAALAREEALKRVEAENKLASLQDDINLQRKGFAVMMSSKTEEIKSMMSSREGAQNEMKRNFNEELAAALSVARERFELEASAFRKELEQFYSLNAASSHGSGADSATLSALQGEVAEWRAKSEAATHELVATKNLTSSLQDRIRALEGLLSSLKADHSKEVGELNSRIEKLNSQLAQLQREYKDLMDVRIALDAEIAAYRRLLEGEESRLGLPSGSRGSSSRSSAAATATGKRKGNSDESYLHAGDDSSAGDQDSKRARNVVEFEEATSLSARAETHGPVSISELNIDGLFAQLENHTDEEVSIGGWTVVSSNGTTEEVFTFPKKATLGAHESVTLWASESQRVKNQPPTDYVWKKLSHIYTSVGSHIALYDGEKLMARTDLLPAQTELFHQVDPTQSQQQQLQQQTGENGNCVMM